MAGIILNGQKQLQSRFIKLASQQMSHTDEHLGCARIIPRAQAERSLDMLQREIWLTRSQPETSADVPAVGKTWIERERPIDEPDHGVDVLTQHAQHESGDGEDTWVVIAGVQRLPCEIDGLAPRCADVLQPSSARRMWQSAAHASTRP